MLIVVALVFIDFAQKSEAFLLELVNVVLRQIGDLLLKVFDVFLGARDHPFVEPYCVGLDANVVDVVRLVKHHH